MNKNWKTESYTDDFIYTEALFKKSFRKISFLGVTIDIFLQKLMIPKSTNLEDRSFENVLRKVYKYLIVIIIKKKLK